MLHCSLLEHGICWNIFIGATNSGMACPDQEVIVVPGFVRSEVLKKEAVLDLSSRW